MKIKSSSYIVIKVHTWEYTVNMYLIGDTPNDWDMVEEKINEYLETV